MKIEFGFDDILEARAKREKYKLILAPCPFCGSKNIGITTEPTNQNKYWDIDKWYIAPKYTSIFTFECSCGCKLEVTAYTAEAAVEKWNTRAVDLS